MRSFKKVQAECVVEPLKNTGLPEPFDTFMLPLMIPEPSSDITIIRSRRRKRTVALHVQQDGSLRVLAPQRTSVKWIKSFIAERALWIEKRRQAIQSNAKKPSLLFEDGAKLPFYGNEITMFLYTSEENKAITNSYHHETSELHIVLPAQMSLETRKEEIKTELTLWYKKQARTHLPERVELWSKRMNLKPSRLFFSNTKQQWGSCNHKNEIRLNWHLILASPELIDYVIVHELAHITHKNHGHSFWSLCIDTLPDTVKRRQALRKWEERHHPATFP